MSEEVKQWLREHTVTEPRKDEHGCIIGKEVFDFDIGQCVPTPPTAKAEPFMKAAREAQDESKLPPAWRKKKG